MKGSDTMVVRISVDLQEIIPSMLKNRREEILRLRNYMFQRRYSEAKNLSHTLKGVLGSYGFERAGEIASKVDEDLQEKRYTDAREGAENLSRHMDEMEIEYVEEEF